jgi:diguanylate cyclase (GGDEF)-like protein
MGLFSIALCNAIKKPVHSRIRMQLSTGFRSAAFAAAILLLTFLAAPGFFAAEASASQKLSLILDQPEDLPPSLFPFHSYGTNSGLGNLAVRRITQDSVGFLWVGTEDGLYRYDGDRFTRFGLNAGLPSTWINDIFASPDGKLWVSTSQGLAVQDGGRFRTMDKGADGIPAGACYAVVRDGRGIMWAAHRDGLFFRSEGRFQRFTGLPQGPVNSITPVPGPNGSILAAMRSVLYRIKNGRVEDSVSLLQHSTDPVESLVVDNYGRIWAQSARKLLCLSPGAKAFRDESASLPAISTRGVLTTDRGGRLWVPTDEGISCLIGEKWRHFGSNDGLPTDWARYVFEDREGSLWVASIGVHRLIGRGSWTSWRRAQGLPSDTIWDIHRDRRGRLWVATDKGLCQATTQGWRVLPGTEKTVTRRIHEDARGRLWIGLMPAAILRYDPAENRLVRFDNASGVAGTRVLSIEEDSEGSLWAATDGAGLLRYRPEQKDFVREVVPEGTPEETFRCLLRDSRGRLWATGEQGLLLRDKGVWTRFRKQDGLLHDHVSYIAELHSGDLCLSYFEPLGIIRFRLDRGKLQVLNRITQEHGLASSKVYLIGEDDKSNLWIGTGRGLDIFSSEGVWHFTQEDGVAGDDIDAMAFLADRDGGIFIGTSSGLSLYRNPSNFSRLQPPKPVFLGATLADNPLAESGAIKQTFSHRQNEFKANFTVLSFLQESQIEFGTRLRGLETEWHNSRFREVRYAGLLPGAYVYEVRSRVGSGPWSIPASIAFEIRPPWWNTWPAIAAILVVLGSAACLAFRWRLRHLQSRTRQLENLVSARTSELAMANADLERLSITDPLTGLKNRRFLEFSIAEDLARIRRTLSSVDDWRAGGEETGGISFLIIDIDHFKQVNDSLGHAAGDRVLRQMGSVLLSAVRESDTTIRWGGEEFLVIARGPRENDASILAERIRAKIAFTPFAVSDDKNIRLTCSIGYASWPFFEFEPDSFGWQEILALADRCLYLAKNSGRNAWIGIAARPDYRGATDPGVLNDLWEAESEGIISIQTSSSAAAKSRQTPVAVGETAGPRIVS